MARPAVDVDEHERALRPSSAAKLRQLRAIHNGGYRPQTLHLHARDFAEIMQDLRGSGFDVRRGVRFRGIPLAAFSQ